jgi:hypothetical protein
MKSGLELWWICVLASEAEHIELGYARVQQQRLLDKSRDSFYVLSMRRLIINTALHIVLYLHYGPKCVLTYVLELSG